MVNSEEFSNRLQLVMAQHDLNASSFAEKIGVGRSSISHILSGRNKPSLDFVLAVLRTFDEVDLYWLLNGKGNYPKDSSKKSNTTNSEFTAPLPSISKEKESSASPIQEQPAETVATKSRPNKDFSNSEIGKNITRVMIFYEDGTFENFIP